MRGILLLLALLIAFAIGWTVGALEYTGILR